MAEKPPSSHMDNDSGKKAAHADLSHLTRMSDSESGGPAFKAPPAAIGNPLVPLIKFLTDLKTRVTTKVNRDDGQHAMHGIRKNRKLISIIVVAAVVVPLLIIIAINAPAQIARSKAFGLYQEGQYAAALESFNRYLRDHPNDSEATFYTAQAALKTGDYAYAGALAQKIATLSAMAANPDFLFLRALATAPSMAALDSLNKLIAAQPNHVSGRLLRGILLTKKNAERRARDDFIQADSLIRNDPDFDGNGLLEVHARIMKNPLLFLPTFDLPPPLIAGDAPVIQGLSRHLNVPVIIDTFVNRYFPVLPDDPEKAGISSEHLVNLYYTLLLLQSKEINEAQAEVSKLPAAVFEESSAGSLVGLLMVLAGNNEAATKKISALAQLPSAPPILLLNHANRLFSYEPTIENANAAIALLDRTLAAKTTPLVAHHNRALLRLLTGNFSGALEDVNAISAETTLPQTPMLRVLAELADNPQQENIVQLLAGVDKQQFPGKLYAAIARQLALGDYEAALNLLQQNPLGKEPLSDELYATILADNGLFMRALGVLEAIKDYGGSTSPALAQNRYQAGVIALIINDLPQAEKALAAIETLASAENPAASDAAYGQALRGHILHYQEQPQKALAAIEQALNSAQTSAQKRSIATRAAHILFDTDPGMLSLLLSENDLLTPREIAVLARLRANTDGAKAAQLARVASARYPVFEVLHHASLALHAAGEAEESLALMLVANAARPVNLPTLVHIKKLQLGIGDNDAAQKTQQVIDNIISVATHPSDEQNKEKYTVIVPQDNKIINNIANAINDDTPPQPALAGFDRLLSKDPSDSEEALLHLQRGSFFMALKKYGPAEEDIRKSLAGALPEERKIQASFYLAKIMMLQKKYSEASELYRGLAESRPDLSLYRRLAGRALVLRPKIEYIDQAIAYLEEGIRLFPADIQLYFELAAAHRRKHNTAEAIAVLRQAARVAPRYPPIYKLLYNTQKTSNARNARENSTVFSSLSSENQ